MNRIKTAAVVVIALCIGSVAAYGQGRRGARPAPAPLAIPNPHYVSIRMEIDVNEPAQTTWDRVGKFCDIAEWFQLPSCKIVSGKEGQVGAVRLIGRGVLEVMVGQTPLSYTYTQPVRKGRPYNMYHGTLEAVPVTAKTCKLVYTLFFDNSMLANNAARQANIAARRTTFMRALKNMKIIAEGGKLPPRAARGPRGAGSRGRG